MQPQILVVGAGPSGLVLALSLLKNGIPVRIIEKDDDHHVGERGPGISPRTLEIEHFLGIANDIRHAAGGMPILKFHDPKNPHQVIKTSRGMEDIEPTPAFPVTRGAMIGQWEHQSILRRHIEALGGHVELGTAFVGLQQDENYVTVELSKNINSRETTERANFAYVIGADGAQSSVRKALSIGFVGETREDGHIYSVDARLEGLEGGDVLYFWGDPKSALVKIRGTSRPGAFQFFLSGDGLDFKSLKESNNVQTIQKVLNDITGRNDIKIAAITWQGEWRPNIRMADHFRVRRVFIAGDAAHVHPPTGGQGLNSSVQDAFNLGWKLALAVKGRAAPGLLESYEVERLPVIAEMLKISTDLFNKIGNAPYGPSAEALNRAEAVLKEGDDQLSRDSALFRGRKFLQLDVNYRWSAVVFDERDEGKDTKAVADAYGVNSHDTRAGDRAPDAPDLVVLTGDAQGTKTRLHDLFSPSKHVALVFATPSSAADALALLKPLEGFGQDSFRRSLILTKGSVVDASWALPGIEVLVDSEGYAYTGYGVAPESDGAMAVIIRPDGMVGAFAKTAVAVEKYAKVVFASM